jgi:formate/nitrite transporter
MNLFTPAETAANYAAGSVKKATLPYGKMALLSILAGMLIAFPGAVTNMASYALDNNSTIRMISGLLFAFGLGMVIVSGAELFTGNTLIIMGVLDKKVKAAGMLRNWVCVYIGNFIGSLIVAFLCAKFGWVGAGNGALAVYCMKVAVGKMTMPFQNAVAMGILCNILVTLGVLFSLSAKDLPGRFLGAYTPVAFFVICGFNHSIADMFYCTVGLLSKAQYGAQALEAGVAVENLTWGNYFLGNMLPVTIGNIIGGVAVGCLFWYCNLRESKQ